MGWTEGKAGSVPDARAPGQGTVRTQGWGRQEEPLLESWVTGAKLTQWQRAVPRSGDNKASETQPHPNVTPEAKLDPQGSPAPGEMALAPSRSSAQLARGLWEGPDRGRPRSPGSSGNQSLLGLPVRLAAKRVREAAAAHSAKGRGEGTLQLQPDPCNRSAVLATHKGEFASRRGRAWPQVHAGSLG